MAMFATSQIRYRQHTIGSKQQPIPRADWECPMCGVRFTQEVDKDRHMTSCGCANNSNLQVPTKVPLYPGALLQSQKQTSCPQAALSTAKRTTPNPGAEAKQRVLLSIRLQLSHNEQVTYVSGAGERTSLVWHAPGSCFRAEAVLSPGQHTGTIHIHSTDTAMRVKPFRVSQTPDCIPNVEMYCQDSGPNNLLKPKPLLKPRPPSLNSEEGNKHSQLLTPEVVFGQTEKIKTEPQRAKAPSAYEDGEIYANVGQLAENVRLKHELEQSRAHTMQVEEENLRLREDIEKNTKIIDHFQIKNKELESKVTELRKLGKFENDQVPAPPPIIPRKFPMAPPSPGPRPCKQTD